VPKARIFAALFSITLLSLPTAFVGVAAGQTPGYPPGTSTTTIAPGVSGGGTVGVGGTVAVQACGYKPGSSINVSINGQPATTTTAKATGCGHATITLVSTTSAVVSGVDPAITCGANTATFSGANAAGTAVVQTVGFSVNCAVSAGIVFTGANIFKWLLAALGLFALGALFLVAERRRSRNLA
jgi:hypothetical protein